MENPVLTSINVWIEQKICARCEARANVDPEEVSRKYPRVAGEALIATGSLPIGWVAVATHGHNTSGCIFLCEVCAKMLATLVDKFIRSYS